MAINSLYSRVEGLLSKLTVLQTRLFTPMYSYYIFVDDVSHVYHAHHVVSRCHCKGTRLPAYMSDALHSLDGSLGLLHQYTGWATKDTD